MKVLITGGAGFIGSTIASACEDAGLDVVVLDDLSTGLATFGRRHPFYLGDYGDQALVARVFADHPDIEAVVHCAASIIVPESMANPVKYYANNVAKLPGFADVLTRTRCRTVLFSSSASVYDAPDTSDFVVDEHSPLGPHSPYAASKWMVERMLADLAQASQMRVIALRYFNPIGADPRLRTGLQIAHPTHALGKLLEARALGVPFPVTGADWPTRDGSGLRDYVHVWDLARAHVAALQRVDEVMAGPTAGQRYDVINLGTGRGTTVFELVEAFGRATGKPMPHVVEPRRPGDVAGCCASGEKAARVLGWRAELSIEQGIVDALAWSEKLPGVLAAEAS